MFCLLYTSDAADERSSVDLGGRRIIKKNKHVKNIEADASYHKRTIDRIKHKNKYKSTDDNKKDVNV